MLKLLRMKETNQEYAVRARKKEFPGALVVRILVCSLPWPGFNLIRDCYSFKLPDMAKIQRKISRMLSEGLHW